MYEPARHVPLTPRRALMAGAASGRQRAGRLDDSVRRCRRSDLGAGGLTVFLYDCLRAEPRFPTIDVF
jgi:hypothetical protein